MAGGVSRRFCVPILTLQGYTLGSGRLTHWVRAFAHTFVDNAYQSALETATGVVADRLQQVLTELGKSHTDVWKALDMSESGSWRMLKNGTMDLQRLAQISSILSVDPMRLLSPTTDATRKGARPYVEDRLDAMEREVRGLRTELKNQLKKG